MANIEVREKDYTYIQHWAKDHDISPSKLTLEDYQLIVKLVEDAKDGDESLLANFLKRLKEALQDAKK